MQSPVSCFQQKIALLLHQMPAKVSLSSLTPFEKAYIGNDVKVKAFSFRSIKCHKMEEKAI